ncbi:MAG: rubrerythrin family protein [Muribaculaceae bacterium]|nr:rubrerythrin family protein [Muribaculaceae bacterium]
MATKELKGTQTEKNICIAYLDECQSYARYNYYAQAADKEQYFPVGVIFRETANNEMHHAKVFLKMLQNTEVTTPVNVDAGFLGTTTDNLKIAMKEEKDSGYEFYMQAAATAIDEGFPEIASHFKAIAAVEKTHYDRFAKFLDMINNGTLWKREKPVTWKCLVCGYTEVGTEPPTTCPGCDHPYQHYVCVEDGYAPAQVF